jgi:iron complex outermembrane receptor protein
MLGLSSMAVLAGTTPAFAQAGPDEETDDIVVTAQRRDQSILDVGITMSVANEEQIAEQRIETVNDVIELASSVTVKDNVPGLVPVLTIRGVGLNDFSATNNPSAGVYVDEVSLSSLALMNFDFFDLAQIEVLKGPQGTLYGRTATAGALNIRTARPEIGSFSARLGGGIGNYESRNLDAMINAPVADNLALRFAGRAVFQNEGFYFDRSLGRDVGRREQWMGRVSALWEPSDDVEVFLKLDGVRGRSELGNAEFFGVFRVPTTPAGVSCPGSPQCADLFGYTDNDGDPFTGDWSVPPLYNLDQLSYTARISADLGFATLTSITGYIDFERSWWVDTDATPRRQVDFLTNDKVGQFSQELRLSGESPLVDWTVGGFYARDHVETSYAGRLQDLFNTTTLTFSDQRTRSIAAFANGEWRLSDELSLATGLRYTSERRTNVGGTSDLVSQAPGSFLSGAPFGSPAVPLAVSNDRISDNNWSWRVGINWNPDDNTLIYASASQAIKSGGFFAGVATNSGQLLPYNPETLRAFETGIRGRIGRDVRYSAAAFVYDYQDVQTFIRDTAGGLPIQRLGNVDDADIHGAEAEIAWSPNAVPGLQLNLGVGWLSAEIGSFASSAGTVPAGNRMPDAPRWTLSPTASYELGLSDQWSTRLTLGGRYQSTVFKDAINDPLFRVSGYWVLSGRVSVFSEDGWDFAIWGENLTNRNYVTQGVNSESLGFGFRVYGAPRTWGITLSRSF